MEQFYINEIEEDIREFEKVLGSVSLGVDMPGVFAVTLYSDWAKKPLPNSASIDDFKNRMMEYAKACVIPPINGTLPDNCNVVLLGRHVGSPLDVIAKADSNEEIKEAAIKYFGDKGGYTWFTLISEDLEVLYVKIDSH